MIILQLNSEQLSDIIKNAVRNAIDETIPVSHPAETDQLLTIQQAAEMLSLSVPTIYGLVSKSQIPSMKKSKRLYFSKEEITNWLKTGRKKSVADIEKETDAYLSKLKK